MEKIWNDTKVHVIQRIEVKTTKFPAKEISWELTLISGEFIDQNEMFDDESGSWKFSFIARVKLLHLNIQLVEIRTNLPFLEKASNEQKKRRQTKNHPTKLSRMKWRRERKI